MTGFRWADQMQSEPVRWLVPGIPRGVIVVVAGRPGWGKSLYTCNLTARVTANENVLFSGLEDQDQVHARLIAAGVNLTRCAVADFDEPIQLPNDFDRLEKQIVDTKAALFVADPIGDHFARPGMADDRRYLHELRRMMRRRDCTFLAVLHIPKTVSKNADAIAAIAGSSSGMAAVSRIAYIFGPAPEDDESRVLACAKCNWAARPPSQTFEIEDYEFRSGKKRIETAALELVDAKSTVSAEAVVKASTTQRSGKTGTSVKKRNRAMEWLEAYLQYGPQPSTDLFEDAKQFGFSERTMKRAKAEQQVQHERVGQGVGSYIVWRLPDGHHALKKVLPGQDDGSGKKDGGGKP